MGVIAAASSAPGTAGRWAGVGKGPGQGEDKVRQGCKTLHVDSGIHLLRKKKKSAEHLLPSCPVLCWAAGMDGTPRVLGGACGPSLVCAFAGPRGGGRLQNLF